MRRLLRAGLLAGALAAFTAIPSMAMPVGWADYPGYPNLWISTDPVVAACIGPLLSDAVTRIDIGSPNGANFYFRRVCENLPPLP